MKYPLVDEFYEVYQRESLYDAVKYIGRKISKMRYAGLGDAIEEIQKYIDDQTQVLANYYKSNQDINNKDFRVIQEVASAFEMLASAVNFYLPDYLYGGEAENYFDAYKEDYTMVRPQNLFTIDLGCLDKAYEDYGVIDKECYDSVVDLIKHVRNNKLLDKIYADSGWHNVNLEELLYTIYDKIDDKSLFSKIQAYIPQEYLLFSNIKENCAKVKAIQFDKFRPQLNCGKQMRTNFSKLIFCKNLLQYFETGIMPNEEGRIDMFVTESEHMDLLDEFKELYSRKFNEEAFRDQQANYILDPEVLAMNFKIEAAKKTTKGNKMIVGFLISSGEFIEQNKMMYLLHMEISDITNDLSNYEMQFNIVPNGDLTKRIQLMRLDNWESEQPHKNVAKKLATRTHIHLYNEFDLLRGKINGNYDIAYNFSGSSTTFNTSLKTFLEILGLNPEVQKTVYNLTLKGIEQRKTRLKIDEDKDSFTLN